MHAISTICERERLTVDTWNINGISDDILGDKFEIGDLVNRVSEINYFSSFDRIVLAHKNDIIVV